MIPDSQILSVRIVCVLIAACSVYGLVRPHNTQLGDIFQRVTLTARQARTAGVLYLPVAAGLFLLTL